LFQINSKRAILKIPHFIVYKLITNSLYSMAMSTQVQAKVSKNDTIVLGGNMALRRGLGGGSVTMILRRQVSPISSIEVVTMVGLRSILSVQTSR
jgi:DnaJ family protein C protein 11